MTSWHLDQIDKLNNELTFIKASADSLQVAQVAAASDDAVEPESVSTMMLRVFDSAERCLTLVNEFRLPPSEIPSLSENAETDTGNGESVDVHDASDDQEQPEYDYLEGSVVFENSIGQVKATFDMLGAVAENGNPLLRDGTLEEAALAGFRAALAAEQQYEALQTDYLLKCK